MYLIQIGGAQNCLHMCMCIEFLLQVLNQKNTHMSFPVGMVILHDLWSCMECRRASWDHVLAGALGRL